MSQKQENESLNEESLLMSPEWEINFIKSFHRNCLHILQTSFVAEGNSLEISFDFFKNVYG
jgi:hypothetical protein